MASILTNNGAMIALQTLRGINSAMGQTQNEVSTGKSVATARDNAAVWAISKVMEADVKGFEAISDSLNLGKSTLAVARSASESITNLFQEAKAKIISAQEANVDRKKLQTDIKVLFDQVKSVTNAAQFNGLNLLDGSQSGDLSILSSLDRAADGTVTASKITVAAKAFAGTEVTGYGLAEVSALNGVNPSHGSSPLEFDDGAGSYGLTAVAATANSNKAYIMAGDFAVATVNGRSFSHKIEAGHGIFQIAPALDAKVKEAGFSDVNVGPGAGGEITLDNLSTTTPATLEFKIMRGGTWAMEGIDVTTDAGAKSALADIETLIQTSIDTAAHFGSAEKRVGIQADFLSKLTDSLRSGIGALVDADMEEVSARMQALQVQQQLGTQALSIANKAPQALLSLFR